MKQTAIFVFSIILFITGSAQNKGRLSGNIIDNATQRPLVGATIELQPGNIKLVSDSTGSFRFSDLRPDSYNMNIESVSYETKRIANISITSGNETVLSIELNPSFSKLNDVVVSSRKNSAKAATLENPLSVQRLTTEDIKANPGGNFDISKVIQSLPGVGGGAAGGSFRNDIIIRGGAPSENVFYLDGIEVPLINHFSTQGSGGGPQGILNVSFIEDVKLSTSSFDSKYDNVLSSVFQFKQKNGNPNKLQGNFRLSATEAAITMDGPISKKTTFLASARRSYLQLLFKALDLPIRPNYWDYQFKTNTKINNKLSLTVLGIGAIDNFSFAAPQTATPEKLYAINSSPGVNQWNYTIGTTLKKLIAKGYWNLSLSRNTLNNQADKYIDNQNKTEDTRTYKIRSTETENKLRFDMLKKLNNISLSYGLVTQYIMFSNEFSQLFRPAVVDANGGTIQNAVYFSSNTGLDFIRYGAYVQMGSRLFNNRLGLSAGLRADANNLKNSESNLLKQLSPRASITFAISDKVNFSSSYGIYYRLPSYTQLAYSNNGNLNPGKYIQSRHIVAGFEYLPNTTTRFTLEGFHKQYSNYPVSVSDQISLANKGTEFGAIGNEPIVQNGKGRAYGLEFFAQQKLLKRLFGVASLTLYRSEFTGSNNQYTSASWDNKSLISLTAGYKLNHNWEIGVKFRYQGGAPYTPYNMDLSKLNYQTLGTGVFDFDLANTERLPAFHAGDLRIDKKWNYKKTTIDLFLDIQNFYGSKNTDVPYYTFKRTDDNTAFVTTDGTPLKADGSNAIPVLLENQSGTVLPSIGMIVEF